MLRIYALRSLDEKHLRFCLEVGCVSLAYYWLHWLVLNTDSDSHHPLIGKMPCEQSCDVQSVADLHGHAPVEVKHLLAPVRFACQWPRVKNEGGLRICGVGGTPIERGREPASKSCGDALVSSLQAKGRAQLLDVVDCHRGQVQAVHV